MRCRFLFLALAFISVSTAVKSKGIDYSSCLSATVIKNPYDQGTEYFDTYSVNFENYCQKSIWVEWVFCTDSNVMQSIPEIGMAANNYLSGEQWVNWAGQSGVPNSGYVQKGNLVRFYANAYFEPTISEQVSCYGDQVTGPIVILDAPSDIEYNDSEEEDNNSLNSNINDNDIFNIVNSTIFQINKFADTSYSKFYEGGFYEFVLNKSEFVPEHRYSGSWHVDGNKVCSETEITKENCYRVIVLHSDNSGRYDTIFENIATGKLIPSTLTKF